MYFGPQFLINLSKKYDYTPPDGSPTKFDLDLTKMNNFLFGLMFGFDYDFYLNQMNNNTSLVLSPFIESSWIFNQRDDKINERQSSFIDIWTTLSIRFGIRASVDFSSKPVENITQELKYVKISYPRDGIIRSRSISEHFPMLPYIFFEDNKNTIPNRYVLVHDDNNQKKNQIEFQNNQMYVYYNIFHIFSTRMKEYPNSKLTLTGISSDLNHAKKLAENVRNYLINTYKIDSSRILIKTQNLPDKPSIVPDTSKFYTLAKIENRRVEFNFSEPIMHEPVILSGNEETTFENDIMFFVDPEAQINHWKLEVDNGKNKFLYGDYKENIQRINPHQFMKGLTEGEFTFKFYLYKDNDTLITELTKLYLKKKSPSNNIAKRFTILFDFNQKDISKENQDFIQNKIISQISEGYNVVIHSHTDNIGTKEGNLNISNFRANQVKEIISKRLKKDGKKVNIEVYSFGDDVLHKFFGNDTPEGRHYNRNVVIEIVPLGD